MLAESMPQIVWITRPDGWNIYFNQQWVEYTGLTLEESYGHGWNKPFHPDDQQRAWDAWLNATQNLAEYALECRLRRADGVYKWWLIRGVPFLDEHGAVLKWFGTCTDIDEFKQADEERKLMVNQLQDKTSELERFIYTVSHDLKSPLITISAFLGYLEEDFKKSDEAKFTSSLSRISQAAVRMKQLLDELLEMSRIGRTIKPAERVDLSVLVNEAVETISGRIHEFGAVVEIDPDLPKVMVDRHRILQVYENLIDNAVKFSSGQEEPPRIMVGVRRNEAEGQVLFIKDNGIGIEPHYTNKVFELFEKLDPRSSGTGVGLAIVKRIIEIHGGKIWAESAGIGHGTTFCFTLPLADS
jgi:PAS domain S-box-containing protein